MLFWPREGPPPLLLLRLTVGQNRMLLRKMPLLFFHGGKLSVLEPEQVLISQALLFALVLLNLWLVYKSEGKNQTEY